MFICLICGDFFNDGVFLQGRHIIKDDMTVCPNCNFPAIFSEYVK